MKKTFAVLALVLALSLSAFADGDTPIGGRQCPPAPQPCPTGLAQPAPESKTPNPVEIFIKEVLKWIVR